MSVNNKVPISDRISISDERLPDPIQSIQSTESIMVEVEAPESPFACKGNFRG